ncbi:hypothetical protein H312_03545 [Anncaliia algerae PRA339]|uniref:Uncharacterized protein n=1 Tax=Anncaliia algerae PRA339 TaxID=1288291 RepID=A0A059EW08_9MICR|nr:hypothetical protein H312_03545 [Anncaliia algerae PRA339]
MISLVLLNLYNTSFSYTATLPTNNNSTSLVQYPEFNVNPNYQIYYNNDTPATLAHHANGMVYFYPLNPINTYSYSDIPNIQTVMQPLYVDTNLDIPELDLHNPHDDLDSLHEISSSESYTREWIEKHFIFSNGSSSNCEVYKDKDFPDDLLSSSKNSKLEMENLNNPEYLYKFYDTYGTTSINVDNYIVLCIKKNKNLISINYHCCEYDSSNKPRGKKAKRNEGCTNTVKEEYKCFQLWFWKSYVQRLEEKFMSNDNVEKYYYEFFLYLNVQFNKIFTVFDKEQLKMLYEIVKSKLKNNKLSVTFYFLSLIFRLKYIAKKSELDFTKGCCMNLFQSTYKREINFFDSFNKSVNWWNEQYKDEKNLEGNIIFVFDKVLRESFTTPLKYKNLKSYIKSFAALIVSYFKLIN